MTWRRNMAEKSWLHWCHGWRSSQDGTQWEKYCLRVRWTEAKQYICWFGDRRESFFPENQFRHNFCYGFCLLVSVLKRDLPLFAIQNNSIQMTVPLLQEELLIILLVFTHGSLLNLRYRKHWLDIFFSATQYRRQQTESDIEHWCMTEVQGLYLVTQCLND